MKGLHIISIRHAQLIILLLIHHKYDGAKQSCSYFVRRLYNQNHLVKYINKNELEMVWQKDHWGFSNLLIVRYQIFPIKFYVRQPMFNIKLN